MTTTVAARFGVEIKNTEAADRYSIVYKLLSEGGGGAAHSTMEISTL